MIRDKKLGFRDDWYIKNLGNDIKLGVFGVVSRIQKKRSLET